MIGWCSRPEPNAENSRRCKASCHRINLSNGADCSGRAYLRVQGSAVCKGSGMLPKKYLQTDFFFIMQCLRTYFITQAVTTEEPGNLY